MPLSIKVIENVKEILKAHKGKKNAIPSKELAKMVGIEPGASNVKIREYITEVIKTGGLPIASAGTKGYYLIENEDELNTYIKSLESRMREIQNRMIMVIANHRSYYRITKLDLTPEIIEPDDEKTLDDFV
ncbi:MAG: hypothetical protein ACTSRB_17930 [Candidatus Helarchaeota archaeon]